MAFDNRPATKDDWKTEPLPTEYSTLQLNRKFKKTAVNLIKKGVIPEEMEQKWFMYYDPTDDKLYMHRSWTGYLIYVVQFEERDDCIVATTAVVNQDPSQYRYNEDEDQEKELLLRILESHVFGFNDYSLN